MPKAHDWIVKLFQGKLDVSVFMFLDPDPDDDHAALLRVMQDLLADNMNVSAETVYLACGDKDILVQYMECVNDSDADDGKPEAEKPKRGKRTTKPE